MLVGVLPYLREALGKILAERRQPAAPTIDVEVTPAPG